MSLQTRLEIQSNCQECLQSNLTDREESDAAKFSTCTSVHSSATLPSSLSTQYYEEFSGRSRKRRRFWVFRSLARILRRGKRKRKEQSKWSCPDNIASSTSPARSDSEWTLPSNRNRSRSREPYSQTLSVSHDSVFNQDDSESSPPPPLVPSSSRINIGELKAAIRKRRSDSRLADDDAERSHRLRSPQGGEFFNTSSRSRRLPCSQGESSCSDGSYLSIDVFENDESSLGHSRHSSKLSLTDSRYGSIDSEPMVGEAPTLSHNAAKHKMAIKPKKTRAAKRWKRNRSSEMRLSDLPTTPEANEAISQFGTSAVDGVAMETGEGACDYIAMDCSSAKPDAVDGRGDESPIRRSKRMRSGRKPIRHRSDPSNGKTLDPFGGSVGSAEKNDETEKDSGSCLRSLSSEGLIGGRPDITGSGGQTDPDGKNRVRRSVDAFEHQSVHSPEGFEPYQYFDQYPGKEAGVSRKMSIDLNASTEDVMETSLPGIYIRTSKELDKRPPLPTSRHSTPQHASPEYTHASLPFTPISNLNAPVASSREVGRPFASPEGLFISRGPESLPQSTSLIPELKPSSLRIGSSTSMTYISANAAVPMTHSRSYASDGDGSPGKAAVSFWRSPMDSTKTPIGTECYGSLGGQSTNRTVDEEIIRNDYIEADEGSGAAEPRVIDAHTSDLSDSELKSEIVLRRPAVVEKTVLLDQALNASPGLSRGNTEQPELFKVFARRSIKLTQSDLDRASIPYEGVNDLLDSSSANIESNSSVFNASGEDSKDVSMDPGQHIEKSADRKSCPEMESFPNLRKAVSSSTTDTPIPSAESPATLYATDHGNEHSEHKKGSPSEQSDKPTAIIATSEGAFPSVATIKTSFDSSRKDFRRSQSLHSDSKDSALSVSASSASSSTGKQMPKLSTGNRSKSFKESGSESEGSSPEGGCEDWRQLARRRKEQRIKQTKTLELHKEGDESRSSTPSRNSKVLQLANNFQKLQVA